MIGAALLADGMITPTITVTAAVEGLINLPLLHGISLKNNHNNCTLHFIATFFMQQFGTTYWQNVWSCYDFVVWHAGFFRYFTWQMTGRFKAFNLLLCG
jgi:K+ transporter